ncbi:MAG: ion channel [Planctomycetota bacterium]
MPRRPALPQFSPLESHGVLVLLSIQFLFAPVVLLRPVGLSAAGLHALYHLVLFVFLLDVAAHGAQLAAAAVLVAASIAIRGTTLVPAVHQLWIADALSATALGLVLWLALKRFFVGDRLTPTLISGAISLYILMGVLWTLCYSVLEALQPGSFATSSEGAGVSVQDLHYFSYVTMMTLGYGDVVPRTPLARSLALFETLAGQMFVVVVLGRVVGIQASVDRSGATESATP